MEFAGQLVGIAARSPSTYVAPVQDIDEFVDRGDRNSLARVRSEENEWVVFLG